MKPYFSLLFSIFFLVSLSACGVGSNEDESVNRASKARLVGDVTLERLLNADAEPGQWFTGGRDWRQSYYSPLTQINQQNITQLGYAWSSSIDFSTTKIQATPIVVDGYMFTSGPGGEVYALEARTGKPLWLFKPEINPDVFNCSGGSNRGVAVWQGKVYVAALDAQLYALDAGTGEVLWKADTVADHARTYSSTGAPYIAGKYVIIGQSGSDLNARGYVSAYDLETGDLGWRFFIVPGDPKNGFEHPELEMAVKTWDPDSLWELGLGGSPWDGMAYDPELDLLFVGTGNGLPWSRELRSPSGGDNLFLSSILAIDADTGVLRWYYQATPGDNWDYNAAQKMILADIKIGGRERKVLMQAPKNGFFYVLDRETGELISAEPYIYRNWASHVDIKTGKPVETAQADYSNGPKLIFPTERGGHNWPPMSYSPDTGLVYIPATQAGAVYGNSIEPFKPNKRGFNVGAIFMRLNNLKNGSQSLPAGWPSVDELKAGWPDPEPRTYVMAWDPVRQQEVWKTETTSEGHNSTQDDSPGVMSSGAGLVFQGSVDGYLNVFDASNGSRLHRVNIGNSIFAAPMTYRIGGEQFVAVMTGTRDSDRKGRIVAFKLGGGEVPQPPRRTRSVKPPVEDVTDMAEVVRGQKLFESTCAGCHLTGRAPDLTHMTKSTHLEYLNIVRNGARVKMGMPDFRNLVSEPEAKSIKAYLIHRAWENYRRDSE